MPSWLWYTFLAAISGSLSVVLAKAGLREASEYTSLFVRTGILFSVTTAITFRSGQLSDIISLNKQSLLILIATGLCTSIYWIFYYKALRLASAHQVAALDKAGIIVTVLLSALVLNEGISIMTVLGVLLIIVGCVLIVNKNAV